MKGLKKILTGILAGAMALSLTLSAGSGIAAKAADGDKTITITKEIDDDASLKITYTPYKIMDATLGTGTAAAYSVDSKDKADALVATGYFDSVKVTDTHYNITLKSNLTIADNSEEAKKLGEALNTMVKTAKDASGNLIFTASQDFTSTEKTVNGKKYSEAVFSAQPGYYLILSSLGSVVAVQTTADVAINEKNEYPSTDKKQSIKEGTKTLADYLNDEVSQEVGKNIYYSVDVKIPAEVLEKEAVVTDTATKGLTLNLDADVYVDGTKDDTLSAATWSVFGNGVADGSGKDEGTKYTLKIPADVVKANAGKTLTFTYYATVNENALTFDYVKNTVSIHYDNYNTPDDFVEGKIYRFKVLKVDKADHNKKLAGVKFTLQNAENQYYSEDANGNVTFVTDKTEITTPENGELLFKGLNKGAEYILTETSTLDGYNLLPNPVKVTFNGDGTAITAIDSVTKATYTTVTGDTLKLLIENGQGQLLPSTGGIGTTIFYIIGGLLIVAAVVFFVVRRKADAE